jgi:predicted O-methyltransferase YrrM
MLSRLTPVATLSAHSSPATTTLEQQRPLAPATLDRPRESAVKRVIMGCARKLHDFPLFFSGMVKTFRGLQRLGINVTPNHFYWPIPDVSELEKREWPIYPCSRHFRLDLNKQMDFGWQLSSRYAAECQFPSEPADHSYHYNNGYFEAVDADMAYCMARHYKPSRVIEVGTGYSTRVLAAALGKNRERDDIQAQLISVDPFPERFSENGLVVQIPRAVQDVNVEFFDCLESGDILFIDSSHVVAVGSDVVRLYLQVLPRLKPGVVVHIHDIFLPSDYPRDAVLNKLWFWSEQYLLQAFLAFNNEFEVLWGSSAMQIHCPWVLERCFPRWRDSYTRMPESKRRFVPTMDGARVWPSSFWMRRV